MELHLPKPRGAYVDIYEFDDRIEKSIVVARCMLTPKGVSLFGKSNLVKNLTLGIRSYPEGFLVTPEHGLSYLESLRAYLRTPYLFATEVKYVNDSHENRGLAHTR